MSANPPAVVRLLLERFGVSDTSAEFTREDHKLAQSFTLILEAAELNSLLFDVNETPLLQEEGEDHDWDPDEEIDIETEKPPPADEEVSFLGKQVSKLQVINAIQYYRETAKGTRSLPAMTNRFSFIKDMNALTKLREYERMYEEEGELKAGVRDRFRQLAEMLKDAVKAKMEQGVELHDEDLRRMAHSINREHTQIKNFLASSSWLGRFKSANNIRSRKITSFVTKKTMSRKGDIAKEADQFVAKLRQVISANSPARVVNADQSGVTKEMHSNRTLAVKGCKKVEILSQSSSALTHSFTVMPLHFASGELGPKLFVVLPEPSGKFPPTRPPFQCHNLVVRAARSHIMTKELMLEWLSTCVYIPGVPTDLHIAVDMWSSFRDHNAMKNAAPPGRSLSIYNIPAGATSLVQPLDVFFFRMFKGFVRHIHAHALVAHPEFNISARDNILKTISVVFNQFKHPRYQPFLEYAWFKAGYLAHRPPPFLTPNEFSFGANVIGPCEYPPCSRDCFVRCSHCEKNLCLNCFVVDYHIC